ncbi:hypothetical protein [Streptomyces parvulus]|uniref:hypothetical protein n=1 Tax=Streptomyces parvulus TaxID=146923 RepID=UPI0037A76F77
MAKHATDTTAHVHLAYNPDRLTLVVNNAGGGVGLIGGRERAQSAGPPHAGHRPAGGYTVTAVLPIQS